MTSEKKDKAVIALKIDGEVQFHAPGSDVGDYDSLCGIDASDPAIGHDGYVKVPDGAKINCDACWAIFKAAKSLHASDFNEKTKARSPGPGRIKSTTPAK